MSCSRTSDLSRRVLGKYTTGLPAKIRRGACGAHSGRRIAISALGSLKDILAPDAPRRADLITDPFRVMTLGGLRGLTGPRISLHRCWLSYSRDVRAWKEAFSVRYEPLKVSTIDDLLATTYTVFVEVPSLASQGHLLGPSEQVTFVEREPPPTLGTAYAATDGRSAAGANVLPLPACLGGARQDCACPGTCCGVLKRRAIQH
jgi:hypothetical protein